MITNSCTFGYLVSMHETEWGEGDDKYTENVYIFNNMETDKPLASCIVYWYHKDKKTIVLRNLYVTDHVRKKGVASSIVAYIKHLYCDNGNVLKLWADKSSWVFQWYQRLEFVPGADFEHSNDKNKNQWLTYDRNSKKMEVNIPL